MNKEVLQIGPNSIAVYQSDGTGPAALLVHGNSSSAKSFQRQLDGSLGKQFRLVAMDLPGHGDSAPAADPQATYSPGGYAAVVAGVANQLGLTGAVFVGWSLGGHILLEAADQLSDAAGFMIFGTPPIAVPPAMEAAFLPNPAMGAAFNPALSEEEMSAFVSAFFKPGGEAADFFLEDVRRTDGQARAFLGASLGTGSYKDEVQIVENLSVPLAILHGEHEQLINGDYFNSLTIPTLWRGAVQVVSDAGHALHWEQAEQFDALPQEFLRDTQG